MTISTSIVVGVDGSVGALNAVRYAATRAARTGSSLELVYVLPEPSSVAAGNPNHSSVADARAAGRRVLDEAARAVAAYSVSGIPRLTLIEGEPASVLLEHSSRDRLLVVGRERRPLLESLLQRSVISAVAGRADGPVIVVPDSWTGDHVSGRIVVGISRVGESSGLLWRAFREAAENGATVEVLHARELRIRGGRAGVDEDDLLSWSRGVTDMLHTDLAACARAFPEVHYRILARNGSPDVVLTAEAESADLMLIARRMQVAGSTHLGSTGQALLRVAPCPIEVITPAVESGWERDAEPERRGMTVAAHS